MLNLKYFVAFGGNKKFKSSELHYAEQDQIFTEHFHRLRNVVKLPRRTDDNPVASKPFATRGSRTDVRNVGERNPTTSIRFHPYVR